MAASVIADGNAVSLALLWLSMPTVARDIRSVGWQRYMREFAHTYPRGDLEDLVSKGRVGLVAVRGHRHPRGCSVLAGSAQAP
jgi:hypothetical protein